MASIFSSYVFLQHPDYESPKRKKDKSGETILHFAMDSLNGYIANTFSGLDTSRDDEDPFRHVHRYDFKFDKCPVSSRFTVYEAGKTTYLTIEVTAGKKKAAINAMEELQSKLLTSKLRHRYIDIVTYDAISEHYGNKLYPLFNKLERNLRRLLLNVYTLRFELSYLDQFDKTVQDSAKRIVNSGPVSQTKSWISETYGLSGRRAEKTILVRSFFEGLDYGSLEQHLFTQKVRHQDVKLIDDFLEANDDLSKLTDGELREKISLFRPCSDWERLFQNKVRLDDIEQNFRSIRMYRNVVAHCRMLTKEKYIEAKHHAKALLKAIKEAIKLTEDVDFAEKNEETISRAFDTLRPALDHIIELTQRINASVPENLIKEWLPSFVEIPRYEFQFSSEAIDRMRDISAKLAVMNVWNNFGLSPEADVFDDESNSLDIVAQNEDASFSDDSESIAENADSDEELGPTDDADSDGETPHV